MEIVSSRSGHLTNMEVLSLLTEVKNTERSQERQHRLKSLSTIVYETTRYLNRTPAATQTPDHVKAFVESVKELKLTKAEVLQLVNLRPTTAVEVQIIVEECEERLTFEQVDKLAELVAEHLPPMGENDDDGPTLSSTDDTSAPKVVWNQPFEDANKFITVPEGAKT